MLNFINIVCSSLFVGELFFVNARSETALNPECSLQNVNYIYVIYSPSKVRVRLKGCSTSCNCSFKVTYTHQNGTTVDTNWTDRTDIYISDFNVCMPNVNIHEEYSGQKKGIKETYMLVPTDPTMNLVPGLVEDLHFTKKNHEILLQWSPPKDNAVCVDQYRITDFIPGIKNQLTQTNDLYLKVTSVEKCVLHFFKVKSLNLGGQGSEVEIVYPFVPDDLFQSVSLKKMNKGFSLHWDTSTYDKACYELIQVNVCPVKKGRCQKYFAKHCMQTADNLKISVDDLIPGFTYKVSISALEIGDQYTFYEKIEQDSHDRDNTINTPTFDGNIVSIDRNDKLAENVNIIDKIKYNRELSVISFRRKFLHEFNKPSAGDTNTCAICGNVHHELSTQKIQLLAASEKSPPFNNEMSTTDTRMTNDGVQNEIKSAEPQSENDTIDEKRLMDQIDDLADKIETNTQKEEENFTYSSYITHVPENITNITWQENRMKGPEITLLANALRQLPSNSTIKIILFREKRRSKLGDIVVVKTESIEENTFHEVLRIKFDKKLYSSSQREWKCSFWDYKDFSWWDTGITTKLEPDYIICSSTHLSAFSILLDPYNILYDENKNSDQHNFWLTSISVFGSFITIYFIVLVIKIHYETKRENETSKILINSSFALLVTHVAYLIYTIILENTLIENPVPYCICLVTNFIVHYFVLAFLLWTAADGINMWRILFTSIFNTNGHVFYRWYKRICWGVPLMTTCIGFFFTESPSHKKCKLHFRKPYDFIFYLIPIMLIFCCNMLLFTYTFMQMRCNNRLGQLKDKKINYVLALTQVYGIGWCIVFPFLCFPSTHLLGEYLFAVVVSTQGILIFVVRCGGEKNLKKKLQNILHSKLNSSVSSWFPRKSKSSSGRASPSISRKLDKSAGCNSLSN